MGFGQVAATSQFYLYGRKHCTATGYEQAKKQSLKQGPDLLESDALSLEGKVAIVTGSNSGVGFEVAQYLAKKGAEVHLLCRSAKRAEEAKQAIVNATGNSKVHVLVCDCSLEADVRAAWDKFASSAPSVGSKRARLDILVCNAGVLLNERTLTSERVEVTFACHLLFGTYLLGKLAMPSLEATAGSRMVVVSSGGMYNTRFPKWEVATSLEGEYSGNLAYAYAKRGQVLLMERWAEEHPTVSFVSSHPGWTLTPAVDAAYGEMKKYLEPMRTPWQGADGIAWLCVVDSAKLAGGAFYLDRKVEPKHIAGPFFTEGSFTKNSRAEVDAMIAGLESWSSGGRPGAMEEAEALARQRPLVPSTAPLELPRFMGKWYVIAQIPTALDRGARNSTETYAWNERSQRVDVSFQFQKAKGAALTEYKQRATVTNAPTNTRWSLSVKLGVYLPLNLSYLVVDCAADYSCTIVGGPDRSFLYVMARTPTLDAERLESLLDKCTRLGYDVSKIERVEHDNPTPPAEQVPPTPEAAVAVR